MLKLDDTVEIDGIYPDEHVLCISYVIIPWFLNLDNCLVSDLIPSYLSFHQRRIFCLDFKKSFFEDPYLFHFCADGIIRCCLSEIEIMTILESYHSSLVDGHHSGI